MIPDEREKVSKPKKSDYEIGLELLRLGILSAVASFIMTSSVGS